MTDLKGMERSIKKALEDKILYKIVGDKRYYYLASTTLLKQAKYWAKLVHDVGGINYRITYHKDTHKYILSIARQ